MDENHQNPANHNLATTEDVEWVISKKSKLLIPQQRKQRRRIAKVPFDWLNLIGVLLIPFVVAVLGLYATQQITQQQIQSSESQHKTDIQIAGDQQQGASLQTYLDRMSDLLLNQNLRSSKPGDEIRIVARARTLTILSQLNATRKSTVLKFIYEAGLISGNNIVISLANADLEGTTLQGYTLNGTDLSNANLEGANLQNTNLLNVNLTLANLTNASLANARMENIQFNQAQLDHANLSSIILFHSNLSSTYLDYVNLTDAFLLDDDIFNCFFYQTKLIDSKIINTSFAFNDMTAADLSFGILSGSSFRGSTLEGANLKNTYLVAVGVEIIKDSKGYVVGISYSISGGFPKIIAFYGQNLIIKYFFSNGFSSPIIKIIVDHPYNPFYGVKFSDLYNPYQPTYTDLSEADLTNANLSGAKVSNAQLAQAKSLKGATMPDGSIHP